MLLHTEYSLLSLLHNQDGVVHHHGLFQVGQILLIFQLVVTQSPAFAFVVPYISSIETTESCRDVSMRFFS